MAQIIQGDLAKIGVTLNLKPTDPPQLAAEQYQVKYSGMAVGTALFGQVQPGVQFGSPYYGPLNNWSGVKDQQYTTRNGDGDRNRSWSREAGVRRVHRLSSRPIVHDRRGDAVAAYRHDVPRAGVKYDMAYILNATEAWLA